jgi:hypothetical protein
LGQQIATLVEKEQSVGTYSIQWQAGELPSGVYLYSLQAKDFVETKKLILLK